MRTKPVQRDGPDAGQPRDLGGRFAPGNRQGVKVWAHARWRVPAGSRAFTMMELMLAVALMGVIVFALYGMFHHTQKALLSNVTQTDVLESGRATMDLLTREVTQMGACQLPRGTNFMAALSGYPAVVQALTSGSGFRTNVLDEIYFLSRSNREYIATSYRVLFASNGVGTLGRFTTNVHASRMTTNQLSAVVLAQPATNYVRVLDGVIHFRARPFDGYGFLMEASTRNRYTNQFYYTNLFLGANLRLSEDLVPGETRSVFMSNALPAYVELELAILEPQTFDQFKSFPANSDLAKSFLHGRVGQVHVFRQRVPIWQSAPVRTAYR